MSMKLAETIAVYRKNYWKRREIPGPESSLIIGNLDLLGLTADHPHVLTFKRWTKRYAKNGYFGIQRGAINGLVVSDPELAHELFNERFDDFHERDVAPTVGNPDNRAISHAFIARRSR
ncbi:hypothetical protein M3Y98_00865800 [Aphelenchoides besseyi]|nr:hypothetical protein M3Y98_00865800 [Aphelenchoides besseyi]